MIQNGRLYQQSQPISVPFTNKQLQIVTHTFRNKLKPGEREEWTLTVSGLDRNPAEMVATLYDASLDTFDPLNWPASFYQLYSPHFYGWQSGSFTARSSSPLFYRYQPEPVVPVRRYDALLWLENNAGTPIGRFARGGGIQSMAMAAAPDAGQSRCG